MMHGWRMVMEGGFPPPPQDGVGSTEDYHRNPLSSPVRYSVCVLIAVSVVVSRDFIRGIAGGGEK